MSSLDVKLKTGVKVSTTTVKKEESTKTITFTIPADLKEFWIYTPQSGKVNPATPFIWEGVVEAFVRGFQWGLSMLWEMTKASWRLNFYIYKTLAEWLFSLLAGLIADAFRFVVRQLRSAYHKIMRGDVEGALKDIFPFVGVGFGIQGVLDLFGLKIFASGTELTGAKSVIDGLFSPSLIGGAFVGALFGASIHTPLSYIANKIFEPTQPSIRDAWEMWLRRKLTNAELDEVFRFHGYQGKYRAGYHAYFWSHPPMTANIRLLLRKKITRSVFLEWSRWSSYPEHVANLLVEAGYRVPSIFYIARITRVVYIPDDIMKRLMHDLEYPDYIIPYVLAWIRRGAIEDEIVRLATEYMYLHQYGWMLDADLKEKLERLKLQKEEIVLRVEHAKWRFARQILSEKRDMFIYQFRAIPEPTEEDADLLYDNLVGIGLRPEMANVYTNQERVKVRLPIKEYVE